MILPHLVDHAFMAFSVPVKTLWTPFSQKKLWCSKKHLKKSLFMCICDSQSYISRAHASCPTVTRVHQENVPKNKIFGVVLITWRINWPLAFHIPRNVLTRPFTSYWRAIYWAPWIYWRRRIEESKETIVHLCLIHICLSMRPLCPCEHPYLSS